MNTLKRKLTAILLTFAMLFSLMPALPQAAEAAEATSGNELVTVSYNDAGNKECYVKIQDVNGNQLDNVTLENYLGSGSSVTLNLNNKNYEIVSVTETGMSLYEEYPLYSDRHQYQFTAAIYDDSATLTVTVQPYDGPEVSEFIYNATATRTYRLYDDQIFKMIYKYGSQQDVGVGTVIKSITPKWTENFGDGATGAGSSFNDINREEDYYNKDFIFNSVNNNLSSVQPYNMTSLEIVYANGDGAEKTATVPVADLRFTVGEEASAKYYNIELADDSFHIVYFYNETDGNIGNNYFLYDIRFVNHGESLGKNMPADPTYEGGTFYRFINWDLGSWDGSTHQPFMSTTIVNDDYNVFARKAASSHSGTEIHVVNSVDGSENELLNLVAKLYNEKNGTTITAADIEPSEVEINVYDNEGNQTNEEAVMNGWKDSGGVNYYNLSNCNVSWNDHLSQAELSKIRVTFELDDGSHSVDIPIGEYADQLSIYMASTENIIELIVNQPTEVIEDPDPEPEPDPGDLNGTDVTVQVYVDGTPVKDPLTYVSINRDTTDTDYDEFVQKNIDENGVITYDFNYFVSSGSDDTSNGYDCVDIEVKVNENKSSYILQGVTSYQTHGQNGTSNVDDNSDDEENARNTFTIDNVTSDKHDKTVDCTIYLRSKYSVKYYLNDELQTGDAYNVGTVYLADEDVTTTTAPENYPKDQTATLMNWQNNANYKTDIDSLPELPSDGDKVVSGWFLGSADNQTTIYESEKLFDAIDQASDTAASTTEDHVIQFYATSVDKTQQYPLTYDANGGENAPAASIHEENSQVTLSTDYPTHENVNNIPVVIVGWSETDTDEKIYAADEKNELPKITTAVLMDKDRTVYAVWGYDTNGNDVPDVNENLYSLIYDANGGTIEGSKENKAYVTELLPNKYTVWARDDNGDSTGTYPKDAKWPTHERVNGDNVILIGWTAEPDTKIYTDADDEKVVRDKLLSEIKIEANSVTVYALWGLDDNNNGTPDVFEDLYTLTYDANGGTLGNNGPASIEIKDLTTGEKTLWPADNASGDVVPKDSQGEELGEPVHADAEAPADSVISDEGATVGVAFIGWSTTKPEKEIFAAGENYGDIVSEVTIPNSTNPANVTVYAVWGYDENGDGVADAEQIVITPADIVAYTGGTGYTGVLDSDGDVIGTTENGMPEPGFYLILPYELNAKLPGGADEIIDLSGHLRLKYDNGDTHRSWDVERYNTKDESTAYGKYIYRLVPTTEGQPKVRLEIRDGESLIVSDTITDFALDTLYKDYDMKLYTDDTIERPNVTAEINVTGNDSEENWESTNVKGIARGTATLTVRGVNEDNPVSAIQDAVNTSVSQITAEDASNVTYYTNDSDIPVVDENAVQLLADSIVDENGTTQDTLENAIVNKANEDNDVNITSDYTFDFSYLDLVDSSNGNAYVTMGDGQSMTLYWPYPEGMDKNDTFYIAHFDGLDRDFDGTNLADELANGNVALNIYHEGDATYKLETTDYGIKITTTSFSPFALVYDADQGGSDTPDNPGWTPGGSGDEPDGLNTEDHFSYIVGYAEDYRTGEPTDNEDLWPVKPNNQITRAEVATIFYRLLEDEVRDEYDTTVNDFSDVSADSWYNQTVSTLASMGILKGYEDGSFRPNAPITRAEFGAIATRFFAETGATYEPGTFSDVTGDEWYANAIQDAVNLGLIGGYEDGTVRPNNNITRAEACAIVNRTLGRVPDADHLLPTDEMKTWPDNPTTAWFYADMQEATNGHEYSWITEDGNKIEEWNDILDKDWNDR